MLVCDICLKTKYGVELPPKHFSHWGECGECYCRTWVMDWDGY